MKKIVFSAMFSIFLIFFGTQSLLAASLAYKDGKVFIADGSLVVRDLDQLDVTEICVPDITLDTDLAALLSTATDVEIIDIADQYSALVTIHPVVDDTTEPVTTVTDFVIVSVADVCFSEEIIEPVDEIVVDDCYAYLDGDTLHVPCVLIGEGNEESILEAQFTQNGSSQNWRAHGVFRNETVSGHHQRHHDDEDEDE